jgi:hypothetical protein
MRHLSAIRSSSLAPWAGRRCLLLSAVLVAIVIATLTAPGPAAAGGGGTGRADRDPGVVVDWNRIAAATFIADSTKPGPVPFLYMGFVQAAVYDAVMGVYRRYEPYSYRPRAPRGASARAAVVAAAHKVLVAYSPYAQASLDADYAASLAQLPDGPSKSSGIAYGTRIADNLIALRANDGRDAPIAFTMPPAPGVWRPTPPSFAPMIAPWAAFVTPMMLRSGSQFGDPGPPYALTSAAYARDFDEVKALGSATSTQRTPEQTATALFYSGNAIAQFNAALRDQVGLRHQDIAAAARMFAAVDMSSADTFISVWYSKMKYGFWRPDTAITLADTDGNPATIADPTWTPLRPDPAYPEWVSGYNGHAGSFTVSLGRVVHSSRIRATLISTAVPNVTRYYDTGAALREDVVNGRMWLGIHFRHADEVGRDMGEKVAGWALDHYFQPVEDD